MCEQCLCGSISLGEVMPGWYVGQATKDWDYIQKGDLLIGRINDPDFIIHKEFVEGTDRYGVPKDRNLTYFYNLSGPMNDLFFYPDVGEYFMKCLRKAGYRNERGDPDFWLMALLKRFLKKNFPEGLTVPPECGILGE